MSQSNYDYGTPPHGRQEISVLRQTVQASHSMDVTDESGGRCDGQSALAAVTVTSEARIRTLNNKVHRSRRVKIHERGDHVSTESRYLVAAISK